MEEEDEDIRHWDCARVLEWLNSLDYHLPSSVICKFEAHNIDGICLLLMAEDDLRNGPFSLDNLGAIKHLSLSLRKLQGKAHELRPPRDDSYDPGASSRFYRHDSMDSTSRSSEKRYATTLKPQIFKTLVSFVYLSMVMFCSALVMTVVNERVPDMEKYPPLPDLFLDNVPYIEWAFHASEYIMLALMIMLIVLLFLHKHRFIICRRLCSLMGTLFLLRSVCMLITSLSVPCSHFHCERHVDEGLKAKLWRAFEIALSGGMSLQGVRYCGDYMFSGHTTCMTLINLFIDEYSHKGQPFIRTLGWVMNLFGIFFVMAGHEHYSIDVFIAFYLSTRLFVYYHTLADNHTSLRHDKERVRIWFPLFSYFESGCDGAVPNEFEWPLPWPAWLQESYRKSHRS